MKRKIFRAVITLIAMIGIVVLVIRSLPITHKGLALPRPPQVAPDIVLPPAAWLIVGDKAVLASYGSSCMPFLIFGMGCGTMPEPWDRTDLANATLPSQTTAVIVIASTAIKEFHATVQSWTERPHSVPSTLHELKTERKRGINKTVFTLEPLDDASDMLLEITVTYSRGGAIYYWRLNPDLTVALTLTPLPTSSPISESPTQPPAPTPDYDQTATAVVQAVVSTVQPKLHASMLSPNKNWRVEIIVYDCVQVLEDGPNAYEQLKLIRVGDGTESVIDTQLQYCGGVGAYGLEGLYWSPNSRYFYYTDAREGSPDGLCWFWERPIYRMDVLTQEIEFIGEGPLSPNQTKIAMWRENDLVIWSLDEGELARLPAVVIDAKRGPISWSPDSASLVYIQTTSDCFPFGKSYVIRFDVSEHRQNVLLESEAISFIHVSWDAPDQISLSDEQGNQWSYDLVFYKLGPTP